MDTFTAVAIIVVVLGVAVIVALVWIFTKHRAVKAKIRQGLDSLPPVRKVTIQRGRVVPAATSAASPARLETAPTPNLSPPPRAHTREPRVPEKHGSGAPRRPDAPRRPMTTPNATWKERYPPKERAMVGYITRPERITIGAAPGHSRHERNALSEPNAGLSSSENPQGDYAAGARQRYLSMV